MMLMPVVVIGMGWMRRRQVGKTSKRQKVETSK